MVLVHSLFSALGNDEEGGKGERGKGESWNTKREEVRRSKTILIDGTSIRK